MFQIMLKSISIRLKLSNLFFILAISICCQNTFANLSELDRWNYIKSLIQNRIEFSKNLITEIATETESEESLKEKYNLIASLTGENYSLFQDLVQKSRLTIDGSNTLKCLPIILYHIMLFDYVPWVNFPERMTEGTGSFTAPFILDKMGGVNQILSKLEIFFPRETSSTAIDPAMVMTLYLRVDKQISEIQKFRKSMVESRSKSKTEENFLLNKMLELLEKEIVQHNLRFLMTLRRHFLEFLDASQKRYLANMKKSELIDVSAFGKMLEESFLELEKFKKIDQVLKEELYALYQRGKLELEKKARTNPDSSLKKLLRFEVDKNQILNDTDYFEKVFLSILQKQFVFFEDLISEKFKQINEKLIEFSRSSTSQDKSLFQCIEFFTSIVTIQDDLGNRVAALSPPVDGMDALMTVGLNRIQNQEIVDFTAYLRARVIPLLSLLSDRFETLEQEGNSLIIQIKDLKSIIKKSSTKSTTRVGSLKEKNLKSSLELKEEVSSSIVATDSETELAVDDVKQVHVNEKDITGELKELSIITQNLDSRYAEALQSELDELAESPTEMDELDRGATIFVQTIEDEYTTHIHEKMKGRHLELLKSIYSSRPSSIRFETLQSLVERCGGILQFDGRGSSHFHITLPGGYTGRSWRLHGGAHSSKIQRRALDGFRNAFRGVADILGINHTLELQR